MSDFGDVIWRLTVRDPQGAIVFGPRTYLSDKPMRAAVKRWEGEDVSLLREFAVRGAWQSMDDTPGPNHWSSWAQPLTQDEWERRVTKAFGPSPRDQAVSAEIEAWNAMTVHERGAYLESIDPRRKRD